MDGGVFFYFLDFVYILARKKYVVCVICCCFIFEFITIFVKPDTSCCSLGSGLQFGDWLVYRMCVMVM